MIVDDERKRKYERERDKKEPERKSLLIIEPLYPLIHRKFRVHSCLNTFNL